MYIFRDYKRLLFSFSAQAHQGRSLWWRVIFGTVPFLRGKTLQSVVIFSILTLFLIPFWQVPQKVPQWVPKSKKKVTKAANFYVPHHTLFVLVIFAPFFAIFWYQPLFYHIFIKTGPFLPAGHRTEDYGMILQTIIALTIPYLVIYTLWPFMVWTKNTLLWTRELYWMGHRTLNVAFWMTRVPSSKGPPSRPARRGAGGHPPVYCDVTIQGALTSQGPTTGVTCWRLSWRLSIVYHLLLTTFYPPDRWSGGSFVPPPPAVSFGAYWYLLVPTVTSRWRHVAMIVNR